MGALQDVLQEAKLKKRGRYYYRFRQSIQTDRCHPTLTARLHRLGGFICRAEEQSFQVFSLQPEW